MDGICKALELLESQNTQRAHVFPLTFRGSAPVIPTGIKTYPAIAATGTLTITNGSVVSQTFPAGMIFTGQDAYSVKVVTEADRQAALARVLSGLPAQLSRVKALLKSCARNVAFDKAAQVTWNCLFAAYPPFPYRSVRLEGNSLLVTVIYRPPPGRFPVK